MPTARSIQRTAKLSFLLATGVAAIPSQAVSYPIDCAILLCLSGGWPASAECAAARAEFIRRITPWPIEPPLQIWRCPMQASLSQPSRGETPARLWDILAEDVPFPSDLSASLTRHTPALGLWPAVLADPDSGPEFFPHAGTPQPVQSYSDANGRADIDVSGAGFDFIRSIRVYDVDWHQYDHEDMAGDNDCRGYRTRVRIGSYGAQGEFGWRDAHVVEATSQHWLGFTTQPSESCAYEGTFRGVAVEWRDVEGAHGYEVVLY